MHDFETQCAWLMTVANQKTVSGFLRVAWRTAGEIARRVADRLEASMPSMFDGLTAIGVDETSYRKGHTYITVVVDHECKRVIWAHDGHGKEILDLFFQRLTPEQRASIRIVTGDGARWIDSSVAEHCPNAERVLDSFHIVSWMELVKLFVFGVCFINKVPFVRGMRPRVGRGPVSSWSSCAPR